MKYTFVFLIALIILGFGYLAFSESSVPTTVIEKPIPNDRFFND